LALALAACGGGGGGGNAGGAGPGASQQTDVIVTDATVDELLSFSTRIASLRLVSPTGTVGANLLANEFPIDLIGAGTAPRLVTRENLAGETARGVRVGLVPGSSHAIDRNGSAVAIQELATSFELPFPAPVAIANGSYRQVVLDVDLAASLSGSVAAPPLAFDPTGSATLSFGFDPSPLDEIKGVLYSLNVPYEMFSILAFADGDQTLPLGQTDVVLQPSTLLLDDDGSAFGSMTSFFDALTVGHTLLEVHGQLVGGQVLATRIEIEDDGVHGDSYVVKVDGRIANLDTLANTFELEVIEIEKGASIANPVIAGASSIAVSYDGTTGIVLEEHTPASEKRARRRPARQGEVPGLRQRALPRLADRDRRSARVRGPGGRRERPAELDRHHARRRRALRAPRTGRGFEHARDRRAGEQHVLARHARQTRDLRAQIQTGAEGRDHGAHSRVPANAPTIAATRTKVHAGRFRACGERDLREPALVRRADGRLIGLVRRQRQLRQRRGRARLGLAYSATTRTTKRSSSRSSTRSLPARRWRSTCAGWAPPTPNEVRAYEIKAKVAN
jgi:hypothetical protein